MTTAPNAGGFAIGSVLWFAAKCLGFDESSWGMTPRAVASGDEALAVLAQEPAFDLALVDVEMPEMSGPEVVARIRRERTAAQLPIAMLTRRGRPRLDAELGVTACVSKPIKTASLFELCTEVLQGGKVTRPVKNLRWNESPLLMLNRLEDIGRPEAVAAGRQMPALRIREFNFTSLSDAV